MHQPLRRFSIRRQPSREQMVTATASPRAENSTMEAVRESDDLTEEILRKRWRAAMALNDGHRSEGSDSVHGGDSVSAGTGGDSISAGTAYHRQQNKKAAIARLAGQRTILRYTFTCLLSVVEAFWYHWSEGTLQGAVE
eukprot:4460459-Prymnesium_polylepis.2